MLLAWVILLLIPTAATYRLNVPRVLLPYHPSIPVTFQLEVSQPTGGCFYWRSTRPDVVSVTGVGVKSGECSDKAILKSTAKSFSGELTAVIFAEDRAGTILSCGVSVDQINDIRVETTTKVLFVDAAPVRMVVEAFNKEGDHFSTLSEIAVEWELTHAAVDRPLRLVPFEQSTYEAPSEIVSLEKQKKKGYLVLVEGVMTGSATLSAKFADSFLKDVPAHSLDLAVVANLLLLPSSDVYVVTHTVVPFTVVLVKQSSTEVVTMPNNAYYLQIDSDEIGRLDKSTSSVYALARGKTEIHLLTHNVDMKAKTGVRPPSTTIHVVDPETIQWSVSGDNWLLETGRVYTLHVSLLDPHDNPMFIGDNLLFDSIVSSDYFEIHDSSTNGTYFSVTPKKVGKTELKSRFVAVVNEDGERENVSGKIRGEQHVQIVDAVRVFPKHVVLPYAARQKTDFKFTVSGGSGLYDWATTDASVCNIDVNSGALSLSSLGTTTISAADRRNTAHFDTAQVSIMEPYSLTFGKTVREAEVGKDLIVNVQLLANGVNGMLPFTDCRMLQFIVSSENSGIVEPIRDFSSGLPTIGTGCATVGLRARSVGDTKITVVFGSLKASLEVSVYPPLKLNFNELALSIGSDFSLAVSGGPRPWLLDPSHFFTESESTISTYVVDNGFLIIKCGAQSGNEPTTISVGNRPSSSLPYPAVATYELNLCCAVPSRISIVREDAPESCRSVSPVLLASSKGALGLVGHGLCGENEQRLNSISGLDINWSINDPHLLKFDDYIDGTGSSASKVVVGRNHIGTAAVQVDISSVKKGPKFNKLTALADVRLVHPAVADPLSLVLWNDASVKSSVNLVGGSGLFVVSDNRGAPFSAVAVDRLIQISPIAQGAGLLHVTDSCLTDSAIEVPIKISDIHSLALIAPNFVEVGSVFDIHVHAADETGESFSSFSGSLSEGNLEISSSNLAIVSRVGDKYTVRAIAEDVVKITATARTSSRRLLSSRQHSVQIFAPISLHPKVVTLIPESTFQLEVIGGPRPTPPISFTMNSTKVINIEPNALITSQNLGVTSVTGTISVGEGHSTEDTVAVRVVSLAGVRLVASTRHVETGGRVWVRVDGLDDEETPFAFGGALYPFKVTWSLEHPLSEVLKIAHPFGGSISETYSNRFGIWLNAENAGSANVKASVELSPHAKQHFVGRSTKFEASVSIQVEDALALRSPSIPHGVIRLSPGADMQLETPWSKSHVEFFVPPSYAGLVACSSSGHLRGLRDGSGIVGIRRIGGSNETALIQVRVTPPHSIHIDMITPLISSDGNPIYHLPVGAVISFKVLFLDDMGREIHAAGSNIGFRPHRFDLTEIAFSENTMVFTITLKTAGETVLRIWDRDLPQTQVFIRFSVGGSLVPSSASLHVSDVVCFRCPLEGNTHWYSSDSSISWLDAEHGIGRVHQTGSTNVFVKVDNKQTLGDKITLYPARSLEFASSLPKFVTNAEGTEFVFSSKSSNTSDLLDCNENQISLLVNVKPPIECLVSFVDATDLPPALNLLRVRSTYLPSSGTYGCVIEPQRAGAIYFKLNTAAAAQLRVTMKPSNGALGEEAHATTLFHPAMEAIESVIHVSDVDKSTAHLQLVVPNYQKGKISASGCDAVSVYEAYAPENADANANVFFDIKLKIKSAAVWSEQINSCQLTVSNSVTNQKIAIPIKIKLLGQAAKHVYDALDSKGFIDFVLIFIQHYSYLIPSLFWTCILGIVAIIALVYIRKKIWEKDGTFDDTGFNMSAASRHISPNQSANNSRLSSSMMSSPGSASGSPLYRGHTSPAPRVGSSGESGLWYTKSQGRSY